MSELDLLRKQLAEAQAKLAAKNTGSIRVLESSTKPGLLMVLGVRRFPISFYREEWETLFSLKDQVLGCTEKTMTEAEKASKAASKLIIRRATG